MRLLGVELGRFRSRRGVVITLLVAAGLAALMVGSAAYDTRPPSADERATAQDVYQRELGASEQDYRACLESPSDFYGPGATAEDCESTRPQLEWFLPRGELDLAGEVDGRGSVLVALLVGAAILAAATFSGADWGSGSMSNQLLFEPRRLRVWLAKAAAVVLGTTATAAVVIAGFWAAMLALGEARGRDASAATVTDILETSGRGLALVAAAALGGFALTMLLRHTVGTLGLLFAYAVVGEGLAASLPFDRMTQWSMARNVTAWLQDGVDVYDDSVCTSFGPCDPTYRLSLEHAALHLGVLLVLAVVVSVASFRARDIP